MLLIPPGRMEEEAVQDIDLMFWGGTEAETGIDEGGGVVAAGESGGRGRGVLGMEAAEEVVPSSMTLGLGVGEVTEEEVRIAFESEMAKLGRLTDEELGCFVEDEREEAEGYDSEQEFLKLLQPPKLTFKAEPGKEFETQWNNYMELMDKAEDDIKETRKELQEAVQFSILAEREIESAKKVVEDSKQKFRDFDTHNPLKTSAERKRTFEIESDDDDEDPVVVIGSGSGGSGGSGGGGGDSKSPHTPVQNQENQAQVQQKSAEAKLGPSTNFAAGTAACTTTGTTTATGLDSEDTQKLHQDDESSPKMQNKRRSSSSLVDSGGLQATLDAARISAKAKKISSVHRWIAEQEEIRIERERTRKVEKDRQRQEAEKKMKGEMDRLQIEAEREAERQERDLRRRKKKRAKLRQKKEERRRQLEKSRLLRAELEKAESSAKRGIGEMKRMMLEDQRSLEVREELNRRKMDRLRRHVERMREEDRCGFERMKVTKKRRMRETAIREARKMSREDRLSREYSRELEATIRHERAVEWAALMEAEDRRSLMVMTIQRIQRAKAERERERQRNLLREKQRAIRVQENRALMVAEDQRSEKLAHHRRIKQQDRAKRTKNAMKEEDERSLKTMRAARALAEIANMQREDSLARSVAGRFGDKRRQRADLCRRQMGREDAALAVWNRARNRRRERERKRMRCEDKLARKRRVVRRQLELSRMAMEDERSRGRLEHLKLREKSCLKIQAWWRGCRCRRSKTSRELRRRLVEFRKERKDSATRIQAVWRGYALRKRLERIRERALLGIAEEDDDFDYGGVQDDFLPAMSAFPDLNEVFRAADVDVDVDVDSVLTEAKTDTAAAAAASSSPSSSRRPAKPVQAFEDTIGLPAAAPLQVRNPHPHNHTHPNDMVANLDRKSSSSNSRSTGNVPKEQNFEGSSGRNTKTNTKGNAKSKAASRKEKLQKLADEWGLTDLKAAAAMLKKQKRWKKLTDKKKGGRRRKTNTKPKINSYLNEAKRANSSNNKHRNSGLPNVHTNPYIDPLPSHEHTPPTSVSAGTQQPDGQQAHLRVVEPCM
eukprot:CAMPEP_0197542714 /NCGR_PEP_ID=MMETSP1318-20131121/67853_1 /TAXON_ID=552666 /ORGANISM="Partenskyella glossopodia, Strain RCC365" /LENGTH=1061 /DNA_ID=CAMNT_0043101999 /DNA_START=62 /DNA_END=3249 /DNA_ORIENTATION=+